MSPTPLAGPPGIRCSLAADELEVRQSSFARLAAEALSVEARDEEVLFVLPNVEESIARWVELIVAERRCCPVFRFELVFEPDRGPVRLSLRGPSGTGDLVRPFLAARS